jgi:hypothetical protein
MYYKKYYGGKMRSFLSATLKKMTAFMALMFFICSVALAQDTDREKLNRLTAHLASIEEDARVGRTIGGGVCIGVGVLVGAGGVLITETMPGLSSDDRLLYDAVFAGTGALTVVTGVLVLTLPSEYEILPGKFKKLPEENPEEIRKKINMGEVYLEKLAKDAERDRLISGGIMVAMGVAELAFYFFTKPEDTGKDTLAHNVFLYQGIINCGSGLITISIKSSPETEYDFYTTWKKAQGISKKTEASAIQFALLPTSQGLAMSLRVWF